MSFNKKEEEAEKIMEFKDQLDLLKLEIVSLDESMKKTHKRIKYIIENF